MQVNHCIRKRSLLLFPIIATSFFLFAVSSCNNSGSDKGLTGPENCITITRTQISTNMLAGQWSVPGNNDFIPYFYFDPSAASGTIQVIAYPADKDNRLFLSRKVTMNPPKGQDCKFPDNLKIVRNRYDFSAEHFANDLGRLIEFDYLRLVPRACTEEEVPGHAGDMVFDVYMVTGEVATLKGFTKPCPPYCPVQ